LDREKLGPARALSLLQLPILDDDPIEIIQETRKGSVSYFNVPIAGDELRYGEKQMTRANAFNMP
jgi:hypothetical protein